MAVTFKQQKSYRWFRENYDTLVETYGECVIVIENEKVVGRFDTHLEAMSFACRENDPDNCIVVSLAKPGELSFSCCDDVAKKYNYIPEEE